MKKPELNQVSNTFFFTNGEIKTFHLPLMLKNLEAGEWIDFPKLAESSVYSKKLLSNQQKLTAWKNAFEKVETNYTKSMVVSSFAGSIAEYLNSQQGESEFLTVLHEKDMKMEKKKQSQIKERLRAKIETEQLEEVERKYDERDQAISSTSSTSSASSTQLAQPAATTATSTTTSIPIKKKMFTVANKLHEKYKGGASLTPQERNAMASGLSGILDLTRDDLNVFSEIEWNKTKSHFFKKCKLTPSPLSTNIKEKWGYIVAKSLKTGSVIAGRKYLDKLCSSDLTSNSDYNIYKFLEVFLSIQQNAQHILNPIHANKLTEAHFSYSVWMPVFERLFAIKNNIIQLKPGESVPEESTNEKMHLYGGKNTNLIGFKIDIRFLFNFQNNEYDLCSLKAARDDPDDEKVYGDHSKLVREGRTNTMVLLNTNGNAPGTHTWIIQVCGLKLFISTVEYVDNNLFVVVPQFNLDFPTSLGQLGKFIDDFPKLFTLQEDVERIAHETDAHQQNYVKNRKGKYADRMHHQDSDSSALASPSSHLKIVPDAFNWHTPPRHEAIRSIIPPRNFDLFNDASDTELDEGDDDNESDVTPRSNETVSDDGDDFVLTDKGWY